MDPRSPVELRALRLAAADIGVGFDRPPYPHAPGARCLGRVLLFPYRFRGKKLIGLVPFDALMETEFKAREKRQNRRHFPKG